MKNYCQCATAYPDEKTLCKRCGGIEAIARTQATRDNAPEDFLTPYEDELLKQNKILRETLQSSHAEREKLEKRGSIDLVSEKYRLREALEAANEEIAQLKVDLQGQVNTVANTRNEMRSHLDKSQARAIELEAEIARLKSDRENFVHIDEAGKIIPVFQDARLKELEAALKTANIYLRDIAELKRQNVSGKQTELASIHEFAEMAIEIARNGFNDSTKALKGRRVRDE